MKTCNLKLDDATYYLIRATTMDYAEDVTTIKQWNKYTANYTDGLFSQYE